MALTRRMFLKVGCAAAAGAALGGSLASCSAGGGEQKRAQESIARTIIGSMTLEEKIAQLFVVTPEQAFGDDFDNGPYEDMADALTAMPVCGIIFFGNNLIDTQQTTDMLEGIRDAAQEAAALPLFLCLDEEGGEVQRIGGNASFDAPLIDHACDIGATGDAAVAREAAQSIAQSLIALGFNVDFAPSCDVSSGPASTMNKRSFSTDASVVADMATAEVSAFLDEGILCCAKHFPGIGDPEADSHDGFIFTGKTRNELSEQLVPFKAVIDEGVPFVMMSHLSVPEVTGSDIPASLSPEIVQGILRDELGFKGIIITDSLSMGAVGEYAEPRDVAVMALEAGCDIALMPPDFEAAYAGLLAAITEGRIIEERIDESLVRIIETKLRM